MWLKNAGTEKSTASFFSLSPLIFSSIPFNFLPQKESPRELRSPAAAAAAAATFLVRGFGSMEKNPEESSPLLGNEDLNVKPTQVPVAPEKSKVQESKVEESTQDFHGGGGGVGSWTADGLPVGHGSVVGEPVARAEWNSSLFACFGRNDEFCSSDLEVCLLGSFAPCVLHGSNVERLGSHPEPFSSHCLSYSCLYLLGNTLFGWNSLAPLFSYPNRTAIRRTFNLEGSCEAFSRSCGCCGISEDEVQRERCESLCDFATHFFCHKCALCQEGRELRRRLPHPALVGRQMLVMIPPTEQTMGRIEI